MAKTHTGPERRECPRLEISIPVRYYLRKPCKPIKVYASTRDIGGGGVCLESEEPISPRSSLELWIRLAARLHPFVVQGKVAWCKKISPSPKHRVGIVFHGVNEKDRQEIISYVTRALTGGKKARDKREKDHQGKI